MPGPERHFRATRLLGGGVFALAAGLLSAQDATNLPAPSAAAVDAQGYIYLVGSTLNPVATTPGVFQPDPPSGPCCSHGFIAKVSPLGDTVVWVSYLSGAGDDTVNTVAAAPDGNLYVAGTTTSTTLTVPSGNPAGRPRVFVAKVSADGKSLLAAAYFGGSGSESAAKLVLDQGENVYLAGTTSSTDFPATSGAYQRSLGAGAQVGPCIGSGDEFVVKFDPGLKMVLFATLIGTPETENANDLAIGPDGSVFVAGTRGVPRECSSRGTLTRLDPLGATAIYSGEYGQGAYAVAVDAAGVAYVADDTRYYGMASPRASVAKIDSQGRLIASTNLNGLVYSLSAGVSDIGVLGRSWPANLTLTAAGPGACYPSVHYEMTLVPYVMRLSAATLVPTYAGYLTAYGAWLAAPDRVVARQPYSTLLPYGVLPLGPPDAGTVTCIADAADYKSNAVAPGEILALFGNEIGPSRAAVAQTGSDGSIGTELAGVRVLANGIPATPLYAGPGQINLVLPYALSGSKVHLELYRGTSRLTQFDKLLIPQHPGMFATGTPLAGQLAALNQDGSVNGAANPAAAGSIVSVFVTGLGAMTPQLPDGAAPPAPVNRPVAAPRMFVNGQAAEVAYAGNAPTLVQGLVQINLRLPKPVPPAQGVLAGQAYIGLSGSESPEVTLAGGVIAVQ